MLKISIIYNINKNSKNYNLIFNLLLLMKLLNKLNDSMSIYFKNNKNSNEVYTLIKSPFHYKTSKSLLEYSNNLLIVKLIPEDIFTSKKKVVWLGKNKIKNIFNIQPYRYIYIKYDSI